MLAIRADQITPQTWRNGGGRTRELLARPPGPDWRLRVSLADIDADGPFSAFAGVQRWFTVVQGAGVVLRFADSERMVSLGDAPLCFDGAEAPGCSLSAGPTRDLNLMVRGGLGAMRVVQVGKPWREDFDERGLFALCAGRWHAEAPDASGSTHKVHVAAHTLLWDLGSAPCHFVPDVQPTADGPCGWWLGYSESRR